MRKILLCRNGNGADGPLEAPSIFPDELVGIPIIVIFGSVGLLAIL
jgi:hypothetical protein